MASVYILYSPLLDSYYTGATSESVETRINRHLTDYYENKYSSKIKDWELFFEIVCSSMSQALKIEQHIKKMKSKTYIQNLKRYTEIVDKLKIKYSDS